MTTPSDATYRQRILAVQLYVQGHLDGDLSLDRLARVAHFSPCHFHRVFKAAVGEGVYEYVRRLRLEAAAFALKTTDRSIVQVALDAGYGTHEAFTRAFRQTFGVSPSQYRAGRRAVPPSENLTVTTPTSYPVRIESVPDRRVAFLRHVGPYQDVGPTFQRFMAWAGSRGLLRPDALVIGMSHDDPDVTPAEKLRFDCCVTVGADFAPEGDVGVQTIPGGDYAVVTHRGPYEKLSEPYRWLYGGWLPASGREPRHALPFEVYRTMPPAKPDDLVTDVYLPLEAK